MFLNNPAIRIIRDAPGKFTLVEDLTWQHSAFSVKQIVVPTGFQTDFATIPALFRVFTPVNGRSRLPAVLHDYLYSLLDKTDQITSRAESDRIFREALRLEGVGYLRRHSMFLTVKLFGGIHRLVTNSD